MKKGIILLPLLLLSLTACDLNSLLDGMSSKNSEQESSEPRERSSINPNDVAIKIADQVSVFPEVGDEVDMSEYVTFDTGTDYKLADFTFTSSNQEAIKMVNGYHAQCVGEGFTYITVSGPGLETPVSISFYVGSIAGNYVPDSKALDGVINLNVTKNEEGYAFNLKVVNNGKQFNKRENVAYEGNGTLLKNYSPFLPMEFENDNKPSAFSPVLSWLTELGLDLADFKDLTDSVYVYMAADPDEGVIFKMRYNETSINLFRE